VFVCNEGLRAHARFSAESEEFVANTVNLSLFSSTLVKEIRWLLCASTNFLLFVFIQTSESELSTKDYSKKHPKTAGIGTRTPSVLPIYEVGMMRVAFPLFF